MYSLLLRDQGTTGVFEFPGPDTVVVSNDAIILKPFDILKSITSSDPAVQVSNQRISGGRIILSSVISQGPGWAVIYSQKNGKPSSIIGRTAVNDGTNNDVIVEINSSKASSMLYAEIFSDQGKVGVFENPGPDNPELVAGQPISAVFKVLKSGAGSNLVITIKKDSKLGIYLVDGKGMTLYQQKKDRPFQMSCYPGCLEAWPPVTTNGFPQVSGGVNSSRLGILNLPNGARVVTYNSLPLYYYKLDTHPGDLKGEGIASVWHIVVP
jgi:predicted lipoprotein with Yx(FWY)xxD motif